MDASLVVSLNRIGILFQVVSFLFATPELFGQKYLIRFEGLLKTMVRVIRAIVWLGGLFLAWLVPTGSFWLALLAINELTKSLQTSASPVIAALFGLLALTSYIAITILIFIPRRFVTRIKPLHRIKTNFDNLIERTAFQSLWWVIRAFIKPLGGWLGKIIRELSDDTRKQRRYLIYAFFTFLIGTIMQLIATF